MIVAKLEIWLIEEPDKVQEFEIEISPYDDENVLIDALYGAAFHAGFSDSTSCSRVVYSSGESGT
jgi:hypothetical protein